MFSLHYAHKIFRFAASRVGAELATGSRPALAFSLVPFYASLLSMSSEKLNIISCGAKILRATSWTKIYLDKH